MVEGIDVEVLWLRCRRGGAGLADIASRALPSLEQAAHLQRDHRPADGGAADAEFLGQIAFGGQALAWLISVVGNGPFDGRCHLLVESQGIDCRYRHLMANRSEANRRDATPAQAL